MPTYTYSDPNLPSGSSFYIQFDQDPSTGIITNARASATFTADAWPTGACASGLSNKHIHIDWKAFGQASHESWISGVWTSINPANSSDQSSPGGALTWTINCHPNWSYTPSWSEMQTGVLGNIEIWASTLFSGSHNCGSNGFSGKINLRADYPANWATGPAHTFTPPDSTPPTITGPTYNSSDVTLVGSDLYVKTSSITISYSATDTESGVAGIWIDGVQASSSGSASKTYTVTADFTSSAYARDNASNQSPTVSQLFKFDNIPPTISNFIVNSATTSVSGQDFFVDYPNTTCDFEFTVTDNESGLNSYKATNASGTVTTGSLSGASQTITLSHDLNEANSSEIKYELEVEDKAGNISTQSSPIVIVDDTPPTGTLAIDSSQTKNEVDGVTYIKTSDVKLSITKSDSESGLF